MTEVRFILEPVRVLSETTVGPRAGEQLLLAIITLGTLDNIQGAFPDCTSWSWLPTARHIATSEALIVDFPVSALPDITNTLETHPWAEISC